MLPNSPEGLDILRHSTSHLMAHAVSELFPDAQVGIGPVIEDGFYYDFKRDIPFTPEDLEKIEARMREIASKNHSVSRLEYRQAGSTELLARAERAHESGAHRGKRRRYSQLL